LAIGPLEIYGITGGEFEASSVPNTIWFTSVKRKQVGLPPDYVILFDRDGDVYVCLDTAKSQVAQLVVWDVTFQKPRAIVPELFFDFVLSEAVDWRTNNVPRN
jgi:hypothetical protein